MGSADHDDDRSSKDGGVCSGIGTPSDPVGDTTAAGLPLLRSPDSLNDLERWCDEIVDLYPDMILGAPAVTDDVGRADVGDGSRVADPVTISKLEASLAASIDAMRRNGELAVDADPARLAMSLTAALHGGSLLARTTRDIRRLRFALDFAVACVRSHAVE